MRPLRIIIRAFGPYADEVDLDFAKLEGQALFLIHGPTGAGKTTILDAICFALFGEAAGTDRKGKDARSHFADPEAVTGVTYDFALGTKHWRVSRTAEHTKPGRVTPLTAQASLELIGEDGSVELRASKVREVDAAVTDLLGFRVDQFRQVVLLPQGEFRRLLTSDSKDREKILEVLFGVELYRRIESELQRAGSVLRNEFADGRTRIEALLRGSDAESVDELAARCCEQQKREADLLRLTEELRTEAKRCATTLTEAEKTAGKLAERDAARKDLDVLSNNVALWDSRRTELAAARRAQGLEAISERLANAKAALSRDERRKVDALALVVTSEKERDAAVVALAREESRSTERDEAEARQRLLEQARESATRLKGLRDSISAAEAVVLDCTGALALNGRDLAYAQGRVDQAGKELAGLQPMIHQLESRRQRVAQLRGMLESAEELEATRSFLLRQSVELGGARERLAQAETVVANAQAAESDLLRRWSEGQAISLARTLADGEPCPVCGSSEHPAPAEALPGTVEVPTQDEIDSLRASLGEARRHVETTRSFVDKEKVKEDALHRKLATLEGTLSQHAKAAGGIGTKGSGDDVETLADFSAARVANALGLAEADLIEAGKAHARSQELEKDRAKELVAIAEAEASRLENKGRVAEAEKLLARDRGLAEELARSVPTDVASGDIEELFAESTRHLTALRTAYESAKRTQASTEAAMVSAAKTVAQAEQACEEARVTVAQATAGLEQALATAGFATISELETARRSAAEMDSLQAQLARFDESLASARARAERAATAAAGLVPADLEALQLASNAASAALETALTERSGLQQAIAATQKTLATLGEMASRIEAAERSYRAVGRVADVAAGNNSAGISFVRFVLGSLLDEVLASASERLRTMSHGRFELFRADERRDRRRSGGLDLEVFDAHTGIARAAATLSGGESFLASLSLALGLADVVQSHTGGIRLETMFIDEGFGTLDPEALDLAMRALEDLQAGGRLVGIISHVPELKERVRARLEVVSGRNGSSARFVV